MRNIAVCQDSAAIPIDQTSFLHTYYLFVQNTYNSSNSHNQLSIKVKKINA